ncbi:MAG: type II toxin-antitoxin system RelE/ParE family toxin [Legionellales bacterium]|nr:type II toxin-antitoxin system RelE/ParE family toxin [Legionellales bacterium]
MCVGSWRQIIYGFIFGLVKNFYAVKVSGNWRIIFRFHDNNVLDVDYLDHH